MGVDKALDLAIGGDGFAGERLNTHAKQNEQASNEQLPPGTRAIPELSSDEQNAGHLHNANFGSRVGVVTYGKVTYSVPYANWYLVQCDDANSDMPCCMLSETGMQPLSVKSGSPIPAGSSVLVFLPPEGFYGFILGVVPDIVSDGSLVFPDYISQGSNMGLKRETYYHGLMQLYDEEGSLIDFSNGRPVDSSSLGDWDRFNELGGGLHIDPFYNFMRVNESCGLFLHYLDSLTRLEGYNFDLRTAISELNARNDSGEALHYSGFSPYAWEALGMFSQGQQAYREISDSVVQYGGESSEDEEQNAPFGKFEPVADDQQPFYRAEEYRGYLGQAWMRHLSAPPQDSESTILRFQDCLNLPGLFREQVGLDGSYGLQSAHSITLAKRAIISIPKRIAPAEAPLGDDLDGYETISGGESTDEERYSFAGQIGGNTPHMIGDVDTGTEDPELARVVGFDDYMAHLFNWKSLHPFYYHKKDFCLNEQDNSAPFSSLQQVPDFASLLSNTFIETNAVKQVRIDDRYGEVDYYENQSSFSMLPDGSCVWRGGHGEEIRFVGGNIQISCPGDVMLQPGRSVVAYGGDDIILKANKSVDISANKNDVRIKAERNVGILGGNSGVGRILVENKADGAFHDYTEKIGEDIIGSGILFKAANSQIVNWGSEIYMRTGGGDVRPGPIVFDADKGDSQILTISSSFTRHLKFSAVDYFPEADGKKVANAFTANSTLIGTATFFDGGLNITRDGIRARGNMVLLGGHIGTEKAEDYNGLVGVIKEQSLAINQAAIELVISGFEQFVQGGNDNYENAFEQRYYQSDQIGSDELIESVGFSFRNEDQYGTNNWRLLQTYWQQIAADTDQDTLTWEDNPVRYQNRFDLAAHPGFNKWTGTGTSESETGTFASLTLQLHDHKTGLDEKREDGAYESPAFGEWSRKAPDKNYPVISQ